MTGIRACHIFGIHLIYYFFRTSEKIDDCIKMKGNMPSMRTVKKDHSYNKKRMPAVSSYF